MTGRTRLKVECGNSQCLAGPAVPPRICVAGDDRASKGVG